MAEHESERTERSDFLEVMFSGFIHDQETSRDGYLSTHVYDMGRLLLSADATDIETIQVLQRAIDTVLRYEDATVMLSSRKERLRQFDFGYGSAFYDMAIAAANIIESPFCEPTARQPDADDFLKRQGIAVPSILLATSGSDSSAVIRLVQIITETLNYENTEVLMSSPDDMTQKFNFGYGAALRDTVDAAIRKINAEMERRRRYQEREPLRNLLLRVFEAEAGPLSVALLRHETAKVALSGGDLFAMALSDLLLEGTVTKADTPPGASSKTFYYQRTRSD